MILLFDQGNTRVRWAAADGGRLVDGGVLVEPELAAYAALRAAYPAVQRIAVSSVAAGERRDLLRAQIATSWACEPQFLETRARVAGLTNGYRDPNRLGVDRWLVMLGARSQVEGPVLVVDAGTAMTVDAVDGDGRHLGGYIVPGYTLQCRALAGGTARVGFSPEVPETAWGVSTGSAVANGVLLGLAGLVDRALIELRKGVGDTCALLLTGGDAPVLAPALLSPAVIDADLLFRGMLVQMAGEGA